MKKLGQCRTLVNSYSLTRMGEKRNHANVFQKVSSLKLSDILNKIEFKTIIF